MKRYEMIDIIFNSMVDSDWIQYGDFYEGAARILDLMEESGMYPPLSEQGITFSSQEEKIGMIKMKNSLKWERE